MLHKQNYFIALYILVTTKFICACIHTSFVVKLILLDKVFSSYLSDGLKFKGSFLNEMKEKLLAGYWKIAGNVITLLEFIVWKNVTDMQYGYKYRETIRDLWSVLQN